VGARLRQGARWWDARPRAIAKGNGVDKHFLRTTARAQLEEHPEARVLVLGHTHQPDDATFDGGVRYYNPGSWTRYIEYDQNHPLTLKDLEREADFPYELNYVRVSRGTDGLDSRMDCFERGAGDRF
jgi:hypothetical protein